MAGQYGLLVDTCAATQGGCAAARVRCRACTEYEQAAALDGVARGDHEVRLMRSHATNFGTNVTMHGAAVLDAAGVRTS